MTELQLEIINALKGIEEAKEFYFTGGSALSAYYLHHRVSEDIDFFTSTEDLIQLISKKLKIELEKKGIAVNPIRNFKSFVEMIAKRGEESMKIQFALDSPYRLDKTQNIEGTIVDSFIDIAVGKLLALFGRAAERDFVDIYFLIKEGKFNLDELINKASEKDPGMDKYYLAIAFEQVRELPDTSEELKLRLLKPLDVKELKRLFIEKAVQLIDETRKEKK
ncbi:MAG: nucleotidyl transferase AbiEii/AbiGii toxin family protein [Nitrospirae bacterium]|nr:nucleotidyl transferase AbiEii/AbiGii toxin family protein [Nitrospirota bacterium]